MKNVCDYNIIQSSIFDVVPRMYYIHNDVRNTVIMDYGGKSFKNVLERLLKYEKFDPSDQYFDIANKITNK